MDKKEYLNPIIKVIELESSCPVCQVSTGVLPSYEVDEYTPIWE